MTVRYRIIAASMFALALAACSGEKKAADKGGTAAGEVLEGSASDAMLPYDSVRSQPPLAPVVEASDSPSGSASGRPRPRRAASDRADGGDNDTSETAPSDPMPKLVPDRVE